MVECMVAAVRALALALGALGARRSSRQQLARDSTGWTGLNCQRLRGHNEAKARCSSSRSVVVACGIWGVVVRWQARVHNFRFLGPLSAPWVLGRSRHVKKLQGFLSQWMQS